VHVVVNHLRLRDPLTEETAAASRDAIRLVVEAGGSRGQMVKVDERHLILILEFPSAEEANRIAREVGGPWMNEHIRPLLAGDTERHLGEVIASTDKG
jgi:hypothetical protein